MLQVTVIIGLYCMTLLRLYKQDFDGEIVQGFCTNSPLTYIDEEITSLFSIIIMANMTLFLSQVTDDQMRY